MNVFLSNIRDELKSLQDFFMKNKCKNHIYELMRDRELEEISIIRKYFLQLEYFYIILLEVYIKIIIETKFTWLYCITLCKYK